MANNNNNNNNNNNIAWVIEDQGKTQKQISDLLTMNGFSVTEFLMADDRRKYRKLLEELFGGALRETPSLVVTDLYISGFGENGNDIAYPGPDQVVMRSSISYAKRILAKIVAVGIPVIVFSYVFRFLEDEYGPERGKIYSDEVKTALIESGVDEKNIIRKDSMSGGKGGFDLLKERINELAGELNS